MCGLGSPRSVTLTRFSGTPGLEHTAQLSSSTSTRRTACRCPVVPRTIRVSRLSALTHPGLANCPRLRTTGICSLTPHF